MYVTRKSADDYFDLPASLPATEIEGGDWLIVSSFRVKGGSSARMRVLQMSLLPGTVGTGVVCVGVYKDFLPTNAPWNQTALEPVLCLPAPYDCTSAVIARDIYVPLRMSDPGLYSVVVSFQGSGTAAVKVTGQVRFQANYVVKMDLNSSLSLPFGPPVQPPPPIFFPPIPPPPPTPPVTHVGNYYIIKSPSDGAVPLSPIIVDPQGELLQYSPPPVGDALVGIGNIDYPLGPYFSNQHLWRNEFWNQYSASAIGNGNPPQSVFDNHKQIPDPLPPIFTDAGPTSGLPFTFIYVYSTIVNYGYYVPQFGFQWADEYILRLDAVLGDLDLTSFNPANYYRAELLINYFYRPTTDPNQQLQPWNILPAQAVDVTPYIGFKIGGVGAGTPPTFPVSSSFEFYSGASAYNATEATIATLRMWPNP